MRKEDEGEMKLTKYTFIFKGGKISVMAFNKIEGRILAQAEAIKKGWDYTIFDRPTEKRQ